MNPCGTMHHAARRALALSLAAAVALAPAVTAAQSLAAPDDAGPAPAGALPFAAEPGGLLADPDVARRLSEFELEAPSTQRGAGGADTERLFAERCRSVVLVIAGRGSGMGTGTGSIVHRDGLVLTAAHVVAGAREVAVGVFPDCRPGASPEPFVASVVRIDPATDLALLRIARPRGELVMMPLGDLNEVRTGSTVLMIGHPKGLLMSMSQGLVSAIRPNFRFSGEGQPERRATVIQTDGALNPGNSGGPMMSGGGRLVGVNSFILGQASAGLNFAISVENVRAFLAQPEAAPAQAAADPVKEPAPGKPCEPIPVKEWVERGARHTLFDMHCSGRADGLLVAPRDRSRGAMFLWDRNGDNNADVRFFLDSQGKPEYSEWDDDFDGAYEYRAEHEGGQWEPKSKARVASAR